jgi:L-iditol 2-dehydrogenase
VKVGVYYRNEDVRVEERPVPRIGAGEALVRIESAGICGSDVMEWYRAPKAPLVLGHEIAAVVEETGEGVKGFKAGDRVAVSHHVPCNSCRYCRHGHHTVCDTLRSTNIDPGGFAQFARVPAINVERGLFHLPASVSFDSGTFVEPLGCASRGLRKAGFKPGWSVLVVGAGLSGMINAKLAMASGAGCVMASDLNPYRLKFAERAGAHPVDAKGDVAKLVKEINGGRLADLVVVSTGAPRAIEQAFASVDRGGTVLFFASPSPEVKVSYPVFDIWKNEVAVANTYGASPHDMETSLELVRSGRVQVEDLITHRIPISNIGDAFRLVAAAGESMKVLVHPNG